MQSAKSLAARCTYPTASENEYVHSENTEESKVTLRNAEFDPKCGLNTWSTILESWDFLYHGWITV